MERLIEPFLLQWKNNQNRKPLILRGARQVGKTYLINKFGKSNFKYFLQINLEKDDHLISVFNKNNTKPFGKNIYSNSSEGYRKRYG